MEPNWPLSSAAMAPADMLSSWRWSKSFRATKTMPLFGLLVKPLIDRPGKAMVFSTPGCLPAIADMSFITASVRSRVAASGNWAKATRYCLSCAGTKPVGVVAKPR
ncbi:hypothetical protein D3C84_520960 [compost metagenome]